MKINTHVYLTRETIHVATTDVSARLRSGSAKRAATFWCTTVHPSNDHLSWG